MDFPQRFSNLPEYAFPRLRALLDHLPAGGEAISMTIGEPKHAMPAFVGEVLAANLSGFNRYPQNDGIPRRWKRPGRTPSSPAGSSARC